MTQGACDCERPGLTLPSAAAEAAARRVLEDQGACLGASCADWCGCEVERQDPPICTASIAPDPPRWCIADPEWSGCQGGSAIKLSGRFDRIGASTWVFLCANLERPSNTSATDDALLGAPCTPSLESDPSFPGFELLEVSLEVGSAGCASGICLVNHFSGRTDCAYGQQAGQRTRCPSSTLKGNVTVQPQLEARRASRAVTCSCPCAGPGPGPYCTCPPGMQCEQLFPTTDLPTDTLPPSFCIPEGASYDPAATTLLCDFPAKNCPE